MLPALEQRAVALSSAAPVTGCSRRIITDETEQQMMQTTVNLIDVSANGSREDPSASASRAGRAVLHARGIALPGVERMTVGRRRRWMGRTGFAVGERTML